MNRIEKFFNSKLWCLFNDFLLTSKNLKYGAYLITLFPFYAILMYNGFIKSPLDILLLIPFIFVFVAGFMFNTLCDADQDPESKNPITRGAISKKYVLTCIILSILLSILLFILFYSINIALILFIIYIFLWLSYSGFKIRFKENILGPVVASIVLFVGPAIVLMSEFNFFDNNTIMLILGLFFIYTSHEIKHTIIEYDLDLSFKCKTFAVITGKKMASIAEYLLLIIGFIFLLISSYYFTGNSYILILFLVLFLLSLLSTITYGILKGYDQKKDVIFITIPYIATRIYIIVLGCLILNLPILLTLFIVWILFTDKYL